MASNHSVAVWERTTSAEVASDPEVLQFSEMASFDALGTAKWVGLSFHVTQDWIQTPPLPFTDPIT